MVAEAEAEQGPGQGRAGQGDAVQKAERKWQETGAQGREQWSQGNGAQSESEIRQRSEVRGREECRGTGIDIGRGRDRDRQEAGYSPKVHKRIFSQSRRCRSSIEQYPAARERQTDRQT